MIWIDELLNYQDNPELLSKEEFKEEITLDNGGYEGFFRAGGGGAFVHGYASSFALGSSEVGTFISVDEFSQHILHFDQEITDLKEFEDISNEPVVKEILKGAIKITLNEINDRVHQQLPK